jgi:hypothetical protein
VGDRGRIHQRSGEGGGGVKKRGRRRTIRSFSYIIL